MPVNCVYFPHMDTYPQKMFGAFMFYIALTAINGGYRLISTNGLGIPVSLLKGSIFTSYFWPAVILLVVVGGTHALSAWSLFKNYRYAPELAAIAGFGLLIWTFTEIYIMHQAHILQAVYFSFGIITLIGAYFLLQSSVYNRNTWTRHK